ncbi:stage V sporulation protein K [uncultured Roseburia sp.]|uniref:Uncharacterized protein n=1 Tax=Brotonthovivens ammoniilytica TaxID=2981725 RepID=A0ABT2TJQ5_9FIRM|nr:hypothetical protein [Brotonthovivens ammoniilytica]MCU6761867.1 hypothetical protein [Brotonthovivens ammoniilytica]SCI49021.1 stage V sporulation protein K [uncultured Roseburia sp.]
MDKYEYKLKLEQLKNLVAEGDYATAAELADSINWKKVRNASTLCMVGDIYDKMDRYEDSRELLLMAYDHSPIGRNIVYKLTEIAIKAKDIEAAEEYYGEFSEIASNDTKKYILRYKISCLKEEPLANRISILEELKDKEYTEEWVYELAALYRKAEMGQKCVETCDELILWFGDGEYVEKALELKLLYQPLTKAQEEKYRRYCQKAEHRPVSETVQETEKEVKTPVTVQEPNVTASKFNTVNLQEELAKSMQQIMNATEKDAVSDTMDSVKKMVEDIPYLHLEKEDDPVINEDFINEQIDNSLKSDFKEFLAEDADGQISMNVPSSPLIERQITGQMSIEEVLAEWEKTRRAAEAAIAVAEQKKLEIAKRKALQETQDLMEKLREVTPILEAGGSVRDLYESDYLDEEEAQLELDAVNQDKEMPYEETAAEVREEAPSENQEEQLEKTSSGLKEEQPQEAPSEIQEEQPEEEAEPAKDISEADDTDELKAGGQSANTLSPQELEEAHRELLEEIERIAKATAGIDKILSGTLQDDSDELVKVMEEETADQTVKEPEAAQSHEENGSDAADIPAAEDEQDADTQESNVDLHKTIEQATKVMQENASVEIKDIPDSISLPEDIMAEMIEPEDIQETIELTKEQRTLFSYFLPVPGMEEQICQILIGATARAKTITSLAGNIIIQGPEGSGKTVLATSLIKAIQMSCGDTEGKIGKISAEALNTKDFSALVPKLEGGYLIVEKAGNLLPETVEHMSQVMEGNTQGLVVVLEDTKSGIKMVMESNYSFAKKFTEKINIPIFTIDELVDFAKSYAEEMECTIDEMGVLALYNRINNIQKLERATTLTEVREIVDEAIESAERGGIKKAFGVLFSKKYNENDFLILREKDFEN